MKIYGKPDEDQAAQEMLMKLIEGRATEYVILHPRKPINARPCQLPGSLLVQAKLLSGEVISVRQYKVGAKPVKL